MLKDSNDSSVAAYYVVCCDDGSPQQGREPNTAGFSALFSYNSLPKLKEALAYLKRPPHPSVVVPLAMLQNGRCAAIPGYEYPADRHIPVKAVCGTSLDFAAMLLLQVHESLRQARQAADN